MYESNYDFSCHNDYNDCLQIYTESLICSGSIDNILLATETLTLNSSSHITNTYQLSYSVSLEVIVKAAQEYFNSAAGPKDQEMLELAKYKENFK